MSVDSSFYQFSLLFSSLLKIFLPSLRSPWSSFSFVYLNSLWSQLLQISKYKPPSKLCGSSLDFYSYVVLISSTFIANVNFYEGIFKPTTLTHFLKSSPKMNSWVFTLTWSFHTPNYKKDSYQIIHNFSNSLM